MQTSEDAQTQGPLPTEKQHLALLYQFIDLGTQMKSYQGGPLKPTREIYLNFEIPGEKAVFNQERGEQCFSVGQRYTFSLGTKANFRKMMDSWIGKPVTALESENIKKLLKKPAMIQIYHKTKQNGLLKSAIANAGISVFKRPADFPFPKETENTAIFFDLEDFDAAVFKTLPEWMQKEIALSPEYKKAIGAVSQSAATNDPSLMNDDDF